MITLMYFYKAEEKVSLMKNIRKLYFFCFGFPTSNLLFMGKRKKHTIGIVLVPYITYFIQSLLININS